jgi:hypothetical protein
MSLDSYTTEQLQQLSKDLQVSRYADLSLNATRLINEVRSSDKRNAINGAWTVTIELVRNELKKRN